MHGIMHRKNLKFNLNELPGNGMKRKKKEIFPIEI